VDDAEYARQKRRLLALFERWAGPLGLRWWDIDMAYEREQFEVDGKPAPETIAQTAVNWRYGHATITWNMPQVAQLADDKLERTFVHELAHLLVNEMRQCDQDDWLDHEERVVTNLTKAFLWLREHLAMDVPPPLDQAPMEFDPEPAATDTEILASEFPPVGASRS
jgi:hypothetical protein